GGPVGHPGQRLGPARAPGRGARPCRASAGGAGPDRRDALAWQRGPGARSGAQALALLAPGGARVLAPRLDYADARDLPPRRRRTGARGDPAGRGQRDLAAAARLQLPHRRPLRPLTTHRRSAVSPRGCYATAADRSARLADRPSEP